MASLALKNLFYDKVRFLVTLTGIVFSVVLAAIQLGLFVGFTRATADLIDKSAADIWISSKDVTHVEAGVPFLESKFYKALATPNVAQVSKHIVTLNGEVKKPNGSTEGITLVGFDLNGEMGAPWNITRGRLEDLNVPDAIFVDELYAEKKLGVTEIGQVVEINGRRARVVGFTRGIRIFTSAPPVFTSFKNAQSFVNLAENQTLYLLVKAAPGADLAELKTDLKARISDIDVYLTKDFSRLQANYWLFGTGAGITVLIAAALAVMVGIVVVAQTIYAATVDHLKEYGTLKAMGASNFYLYRVIIAQALLSGVIGYAFGISIALAVSYLSLQGTTAIILPLELVGALFGLTLLMCAGASIVSINKVTRIDPAMVFKG